MSNTLEVLAAASRAPGGWAEVRAADQTTRYMRFGAGAGSAVVILIPAASDANVWPELFESLSAERRVYLPDLPDTEGSFATRIRAFLDGLGLSPVTLIAPGSFCVPALEFALLEPDRLQRLVLVPRGASEETGLTGALSTPAPARPIPVLIVRRDTGAEHAVKQVRAFVAEG
jgi:pimeloyl-ACP methyl ester carboxylesterase